MFYKRIFTSVIICGLIFGFVFFIRLQLTGISRKPAPEFLPNVARFRPSRVCSSRALVLVNSSPSHAHRRQVIRETWAHPTVTQSMDISVAFGIGEEPSSDLQRSLDWEAEVFGDIFQEPGADTGASSSAQAIHLLKSIRSACTPVPEFILKMEDSVFVNPFSLDDLLLNLETFSSSNTMWCLEWQRTFDKHRSNSTWMVLQTPLNDNAHPTYCLSTVYLMTGRTLDAIIRRHDARIGRVMLPEDVYVTGMLPKEAGVVLSFLGERVGINWKNEQNVDAWGLVFAYLGEEMENETGKLWRAVVKKKINLTRRYDVGL